MFLIISVELILYITKKIHVDIQQTIFVEAIISIQLVSCKNFSAKQTWHNQYLPSLSDGDDFQK